MTVTIKHLSTRTARLIIPDLARLLERHNAFAVIKFNNGMSGTSERVVVDPLGLQAKSDERERKKRRLEKEQHTTCARCLGHGAVMFKDRPIRCPLCKGTKYYPV